jgi:SPP1 gp7 family putative phage head morphogenesis protein
MAAAFKRSGFTVEFKPTRASMQAYRAVAAENVGLIKSIPQEYLTDVQSNVWESVKAGADLSTLSKNLRETYGVAARRAAFIATDQNNKAKAIIEDTRRNELGIQEAIWQHSHAGKVPRHTHVRMNGKTYKIGVGMYDSAVKKYVWPGTEPNCRCTSRAIIPPLGNRT